MANVRNGTYTLGVNEAIVIPATAVAYECLVVTREEGGRAFAPLDHAGLTRESFPGESSVTFFLHHPDYQEQQTCPPIVMKENMRWALLEDSGSKRRYYEDYDTHRKVFLDSTEEKDLQSIVHITTVGYFSLFDQVITHHSSLIALSQSFPLFPSLPTHSARILELLLQEGRQPS